MRRATAPALCALGVTVTAAIVLGMEASRPILQVDFNDGYDGLTWIAGTNGQTEAKAIKAGLSGVQSVEGKGGKAVYLRATTIPGDILYYHVTGLISPFLGTLACSVKIGWKAGDGRRHIILDLRNREHTGYVLEKTADGRLSFSSQEKGRVLTEATAPAEALGDNQWHAIRACWHTEGLKLFLDGVQKAASSTAVIPSALGQHLFVGSCYEAVNQLDGAIDDVRVGLTTGLAP